MDTHFSAVSKATCRSVDKLLIESRDPTRFGRRLARSSTWLTLRTFSKLTKSSKITRLARSLSHLFQCVSLDLICGSGKPPNLRRLGTWDAAAIWRDFIQRQRVQTVIMISALKRISTFSKIIQSCRSGDQELGIRFIKIVKPFDEGLPIFVLMNFVQDYKFLVGRELSSQ